MTFPAIDGNELGVMVSVSLDRAIIPFLTGSVKWLSNPELWDGDPEDVYETTQAFERLVRALAQANDP